MGLGIFKNLASYPIFRLVVCLVFVCGPFLGHIAAQNETVRRLNREGYLAYRQQNWGLALEKFEKATELAPYYVPSLYNQACVLSLRAHSQNRLEDIYPIYRLLLEVLLQAEYREKIQSDPDLAWFRNRAPGLLANLKTVQRLDSEIVYRKLRERPVWDVDTTMYLPITGANSVLPGPKTS